MNSIYIGSTQNVSVGITITPTIISTDTYVLNLTLATMAKIINFHVSMLIFDESSINLSNYYYIASGYLQFNNLGGF